MTLPSAPKFNIVSQPNDWSKTVAAGASQVENTLTESRLLQREFWSAFRDFVKDKDSRIKTTKALPQNWTNIAIGRSGIRLCAVASFWDSVKETYDSHELRTEVVLDDNNSKTYYEQLFAQKEKNENEMGEPLNWHNPADKRVCRIYLRCGADLENRDNWSKQH